MSVEAKHSSEQHDAGECSDISRAVLREVEGHYDQNGVADRKPTDVKSKSRADQSSDADDAESIKSTAVVVYSRGVTPVSFQCLDTNLDICKPPANWYRARSPVERYVQQALHVERSQFSSFHVANDKLELMDDMDVISDSENIKKLLKMAYSSAPVSLMVHRIGRTLLLDDFDVHRHLLRRQREDWHWMRQFYATTVEAESAEMPAHAATGASCPPAAHSWHKRRGRNDGAVPDRNMLSKFYYHSIQVPVAESNRRELPPSFDDTHEAESPPSSTRSPGVHTNEAADAASEQKGSGSCDFERTLIWNFEDIKMLIGTDLPIFGGGSQPAVSLRLRDAKTPINVLTGLEYWLDNLMCNVPEIAMCYHLNGIVQQYERIRTEDIPYLEGSSFSPHRIKDVAQNILSFLKSKAAREGHTYWLFKEGNGEVVKLYDLTVLCDSVNDARQNPFTVPLGMLLYRVASNLLQQPRENQKPKKADIIRGLLGNCLLLLDAERHARVVASANMLLSDLFLVGFSDDEYSTEDEDAEQPPPSSSDEDEDKSFLHTTSDGQSLPSLSRVHVGALCAPRGAALTRSDARHFVPFVGGSEERLVEALRHAADALICLDKSSLKEVDLNRVPSSSPLMSREAIPLPYAPLSSHNDVTNHHIDLPVQLPDETADGSASRRATERGSSLSACAELSSHTWHCVYKLHLLRNAVSALLGLADWKHVAAARSGAALKYLRLTLRCLAALDHMQVRTDGDDCKPGAGTCLYKDDAQRHEDDDKLLQALRLCGDVQVGLAGVQQQRLGCSGTSLPEEKANDGDSEESLAPYESAISMSAEKELHACSDVNVYEWACQRHSSAVKSLRVALQCYDVVATIMSRLLSAANSRSEEPAAPSATVTESARVQLQRRMAHAKNELAVCLMNAAAQLCLQGFNGWDARDDAPGLLAESHAHLESSLASFVAIGDDTNTALLLSNTGRLLRIEAQVHAACSGGGPSGAPRGEFSATERQLYCKAVELYTKALLTAKAKDRGVALSEHIRYELSGAYFSWALLLQDHPPLSALSKDEIEREFADLSMKALKHCGHQVSVPSMSQSEQADRCHCAAIHHRLAAMYHNAYRLQQESEQRKRQLRCLAELHYSKAAARLLAAIVGAHGAATADLALELLRIQLERVALAEFHWQELAHSHSAKVITKPLKAALLVLAEEPTFEAVCSLEQHLLLPLSSSGASDLPEPCCDDGSQLSRLQESGKLLGIAAARLRFILLHINKAASAQSKKRPGEGGLPLASRYRVLYEQALQLAKDEQAGAGVQELCLNLRALLATLRSQRDELLS